MTNIVRKKYIRNLTVFYLAPLKCLVPMALPFFSLHLSPDRHQLNYYYLNLNNSRKYNLFTNENIVIKVFFKHFIFLV